MASVRLNFSPPIERDIVKLHILEASSQTGTFSEIEEVDQIGTYPNYISYYTTDLAQSAYDWFRIQWEDDKGALSDLSEAVQGGTESYVGELTEWVMLRDSTINENVASQEVESALFQVFGTTTPDSLNPNEKSGIVLLAMARIYLTKLGSSSGRAQKWTAGLITMDTGTTAAQQSKANIDALLKQAGKLLGVAYGVIAQMAEVEVAGVPPEIVTFDPSRLLIEVQ
jgi:hypothetical protein